MSHVNGDLSTYSYGSKFVTVSIILIFLLVATVLNCNKVYNLSNVGFAFNQNNNNNNGTSINIISKDKAIISFHNIIKIKESSSNLNSNASTTNNDKLVIL